MAPAHRLYDRIGTTYAVGRRTDERIARHIWAALGDARSVLNVGAGTGSYEPPDRFVVALEPSSVMQAQRPEGAGPCVGGLAEALPFADGSFDVAMAVLSDHHWTDPIAGLREMQRVARRVVVFQWDNVAGPTFWLIDEYLPEFAHHLATSTRPSLADRVAAIGATVTTVPVPWDCVDGFFHAYWRRPEAYLDQAIRDCTSVWALLGSEVEQRATQALAADLASGAWSERHSDLAALDEADVGARLLVA